MDDGADAPKESLHGGALRSKVRETAAIKMPPDSWLQR